MTLLSHIRKEMEIITADRMCLGRVSYLIEPDQIGVSGQTDLVPVDWIAWVDGSVYLSKTYQEIKSDWDNAEPQFLIQPDKLPLSARAGAHLPIQK